MIDYLNHQNLREIDNENSLVSTFREEDMIDTQTSKDIDMANFSRCRSRY